ncbi:MAG: hypothetical protein ACM3XZ_08095 [Betaproteobacteria bacterium]
MHGWITQLAPAAGAVGAGFASGREAAAFFAPYGGWGLVAIPLVVLLVGQAASRPPRPLPAPLRSVGLLLLWTTLAATLAAGGEILSHLAGWSAPVGAAGLGVLAAVLPGQAGTRRTQAVTVLLLAGAILLVGGAAGARPGSGAAKADRWAALPGIANVEAAPWPEALAILAPVGAFRRESGGALPPPLAATLAAVLYASYTSALVAGGMPDEPRGGGAWPAAALIGALLAVMVIALHRSPVVREAALPMLALAADQGARFAKAYAYLLGAAAANAAVANARALGDSLAGLLGGPTMARWVAVLLAWAASALGFARLVGTVYPLLGWAWLPALLGQGRPCTPHKQGI